MSVDRTLFSVLLVMFLAGQVKYRTGEGDEDGGEINRHGILGLVEQRTRPRLGARWMWMWMCP